MDKQWRNPIKLIAASLKKMSKMDKPLASLIKKIRENPNY